MVSGKRHLVHRLVIDTHLYEPLNLFCWSKKAQSAVLRSCHQRGMPQYLFQPRLGGNVSRHVEDRFIEAIEKRINLVEIIPGKGSGQLKKKVLRFLNQGHIKKLYHRVEKDDKNFGRIFIHFKF